MYLRCDGTFSVDFWGNARCTNWVQLTPEQLLSDLPATSLDILANSTLTNADYLFLASSIALYFLTCWSFNILGRQLNPR